VLLCCCVVLLLCEFFLNIFADPRCYTALITTKITNIATVVFTVH
jgi:hypothetical protein